MNVRNTNYRGFDENPERLPVWSTLCIIAAPGLLFGLALWCISTLIPAGTGIGGVVGRTCFWSSMFILVGNGIILLFGIFGWYINCRLRTY
jgi:hypothetical protein